MDPQDQAVVEQLLEGVEGAAPEPEEDIDIESIFKPAESELSPREKALSERLQQLEANQQYQTQAQIQQQHNTVIAEINRLPPEQQAAAQYLYKAYLYGKQQEYRATQAEQYARHLETSTVPLVKDKLLTSLSEKSKVERSIIEKYGTTPDAAKAVVAALVEYKKANNLNARKTAGMDNVPSAASASGSQSVPQSNPEVKKRFANTGDLEGFLRAGGLNR